MIEALACVKPAALVLTAAAVAVAIALVGAALILWLTRRSAHWSNEIEQLREQRGHQVRARVRAGAPAPADRPLFQVFDGSRRLP